MTSNLSIKLFTLVNEKTRTPSFKRFSCRVVQASRPDFFKTRGIRLILHYYRFTVFTIFPCFSSIGSYTCTDSRDSHRRRQDRDCLHTRQYVKWQNRVQAWCYEYKDPLHQTVPYVSDVSLAWACLYSHRHFANMFARCFCVVHTHKL